MEITNPVDISSEGLKDIVDHVMGGLSREASYKKISMLDRGPTSGTIDEKIAAAVKEKLTKSSSVEDHIEDFKDSDAPQFKGKSLKKSNKWLWHRFYLNKVNLLKRIWLLKGYRKGN